MSGGFSNNAAVLGVSPLLAEKYQEAAEALAAAAVKDLPALVGCDPPAAARRPAPASSSSASGGAPTAGR